MASKIAYPAYKSTVKLFKKLQEVTGLYDGLPSYCFKPKQIQCWEHLLNGIDVIGVLPTGYGKSITFQLLSDLLPAKFDDKNNIVIVVCPLNSIMEDRR